MTTVHYWTRAPAVAFVDDGERVAALALDRIDEFGARLHMGPAAAVWRTLASESDFDEIVRTVAGVFDADVSVVRADVQYFLEDLQTRGLVVPIDE